MILRLFKGGRGGWGGVRVGMMAMQARPITRVAAGRI